MKYITRHAILFDSDGYLQERGVEVIDHLDGTIQVGGGLHREDHLTVAEDRIESINGWFVTWDKK